LRETLLPKFVETTIERQEVDKSNEEVLSASRKTQKKITNFVRLIKLCPDKDFLVKFYQQREEEYDSIL
jgi:hypothetical protein